jgi:hypothetical protein
MDAETQKQINDLKAAMRGVADALRQFQLYVDGKQKPTREGLKRLNDYLNAVDRAVNPGGIRGLMTP